MGQGPVSEVLPSDQLGLVEVTLAKSEIGADRLEGTVKNGSTYTLWLITLRITGDGDAAPPAKSYETDIPSTLPGAESRFSLRLLAPWPADVAFKFVVEAAIGSRPAVREAEASLPVAPPSPPQEKPASDIDTGSPANDKVVQVIDTGAPKAKKANIIAIVAAVFAYAAYQNKDPDVQKWGSGRVVAMLVFASWCIPLCLFAVAAFRYLFLRETYKWHGWSLVAALIIGAGMVRGLSPIVTGEGPSSPAAQKAAAPPWVRVTDPECRCAFDSPSKPNFKSGQMPDEDGRLHRYASWDSSYRGASFGLIQGEISVRPSTVDPSGDMTGLEAGIERMIERSGASLGKRINGVEARGAPVWTHLQYSMLDAGATGESIFIVFNGELWAATVGYATAMERALSDDRKHFLQSIIVKLPDGGTWSVPSHGDLAASNARPTP